MKLKNKIVLITGASGGIGGATALLFAKEGARVVINYNTSEKEALALAKHIKESGGDVITIKTDVSDEGEVKKMFEETREKFGEVDILINNAGIVFDEPFAEKTVDHWKRTLDVNLLSVFLCSKYASQQMAKTGSGSIVNISSTNGIDSFSPEAMDYDASKAGVNILTRGLAKELAPNIRVNAVAPGWVDTPLNKDLPAEFIAKEKAKIYLKRLANPEEIARAILFLASDEASFVTGSILKVDGGYG